MEIVTFIAGVCVGYIIEKLLDIMTSKIQKIIKFIKWRKKENFLEKYRQLVHGLELIQYGWNNGTFNEDQVFVTKNNEFKLSDEIREKILLKNISYWNNNSLQNNPQIGVSFIDPHRTTDEISTTTDHELVIHGQVYNYYDFLATNQKYSIATKEELWFFNSIIKTPQSLQPVPQFPNPLSVGLSVFCEDGNLLVLTRRTMLPSSGGLHSGNLIYNAIGENMISNDTYGYKHNGFERLSPWMTAKRGMSEEMGFNFNNKKMSLLLHTIAWDKRILDYKFFGYVITPFSKIEVEDAWQKASDKNENLELFFIDCTNQEKTHRFVKELLINKSQYASECTFCTITSLLLMNKLSVSRLQKSITNP